MIAVYHQLMLADTAQLSVLQDPAVAVPWSAHVKPAIGVAASLPGSGPGEVTRDELLRREQSYDAMPSVSIGKWR